MTAFTQPRNFSDLPRELLPTMYDLPSEEPGDPGVPDEFHLFQPELLRQTFATPCYPSEEVFVAADLNVYYDPNHLRWYKRPDWFVAVGVSRLYNNVELRLSYVMWQERVAPTVVVELLSPGTHKDDLGEHSREPESDEESPNGSEGLPKPPGKWEVYEQILQVPHYVVFDRYSDELRYFKLEGRVYQEQTLCTVAPQIWIPELQVGLGLWQGRCEGIERLWLRWCDAEGNWRLTGAEAAKQQAEVAKQQAEVAKQQAEVAKQQAEAAKQQAEVAKQLTEAATQQAEAATQQAEAAERARRNAIPQLLGMGLSVEQVAIALGLSVEEVERDRS